jgi:hypothetical protein
MTVSRPRSERILRLADEVRAKILAEEQLIARAEGKITLDLFPKGEGYDIKLTITTR